MIGILNYVSQYPIIIVVTLAFIFVTSIIVDIANKGSSSYSSNYSYSNNDSNEDKEEEKEIYEK